LSEPPPLAESIFKKIFSIERVHANLPFPEVPLMKVFLPPHKIL
jgi:hypothetical protein